MNLKNKRITVTGGAGFLGQNVVKILKEKGCKDIFIPRSKDCDLKENKNCIRSVQNRDIVIHLAAVVGGIGANRANLGKFFYGNAIMGIQLIEQARLAGIEKFVALGTISCYPKFTPIPFKEENLWDGYPEETNAPYGLAKKMLLVQSQAYREQYGMNSIFLMPTNLYGPGDNFNPESSHVVPALVKKCVDALEEGKKEITVWGDGSPTRDFVYVEDAAEAIVLATERYNKPDPVNIGSGFEITIKNLVNIIAEYIGFKGKIIWDTNKPNGQPRRCLDTSKAEIEFGFKAKTNLNEGLKKTIKWYLDNKSKIKFE